MALYHAVSGGQPVEVKKVMRKQGATETEVNYVIRDNKLVYAKPGMYLAGPVNETVVGNLVIEDNVVSGFNTSSYNYLKSEQKIDSSKVSKILLKIRLNDLTTTNCVMLSVGTEIRFATYNNGYYININGNYWREFNNVFSLGNWKWIRLENDGTNLTIFHSNDGINFTQVYTGAKTIDAANVDVLFGQLDYNQNSSFIGGEIDLNDTYIEKEGNLWFYGKNYSSKNIAPVPAGFTYGTTTTSAVGWVDMRTQQFTAAPVGATLGED